jgi:hypothetical protein
MSTLAKKYFLKFQKTISIEKDSYLVTILLRMNCESMSTVVNTLKKYYNVPYVRKKKSVKSYHHIKVYIGTKDKKNGML